MVRITFPDRLARVCVRPLLPGGELVIGVMVMSMTSDERSGRRLQYFKVKMKVETKATQSS